MTCKIKWFNTQREAINYKKKLKGTRNFKWTTQGNSVVKVLRKTGKPLKKLKIFK